MSSSPPEQDGVARPDNFGRFMHEFTHRCRNCQMLDEQHGPDGKCLFDSTSFVAYGTMEDQRLLIAAKNSRK